MIDTLSYINNMNHGVVPILGSGKQFKSGTMYSILSSLSQLSKRRKAFYEFPDVNDLFPSSLNAYPVNNVWDVEPDSILVIEDANRVFSSRGSSSDPLLQKFMGLISHKDILIFMTVQNTSDTDKAFFRSQEIVVLHKKMDPKAIQYEREEFQSDCAFANVIIDDSAKNYGVSPYYISYCAKFGQPVILPNPPDWYGYAQSHALRNYDPRSVSS